MKILPGACVQLALRILVIFSTVSTASGQSVAAWITIRNDTTSEILIQDVVVVNGKNRYGKAIKLLPGESVRENQTKAGTKTLRVFDPTNTETPIAKGKLEWKSDDVTYSIQTEKNTTNIAAVPPPAKKP